MDRKYRQRGYDEAEREKRTTERPKADRDGPRSPNMTAFQGVMRCGMCGAVQPLDPTEITPASVCPSCSADLRTCRNCVSFDPGARWECRAPITLRVASKTKRNECEHFTPRKTVEKKTGEARTTGSGPSDARDAFERLFKK